MIFSDGKILDYQLEGENLKMKFLDYSDNKLEIKFSGEVSYEKNEGYEFELADSKLREENNLKILELLNDENFCVIKIQFTHADIIFL